MPEPAGESPIELSIVMPCLNEADTLEACIRKALRALAEQGIAGEVLVADNGSTDGSPALAERLGARVVPIAERGYGNALMGGIEAARGRFVLMADADDSYDFLEAPRFLERLRAGADLVQGCRLPAGGGTVLPGAMPWSHRWIGNPLFSLLARAWFRAPVHDVYCGMRAFSKALYARLGMCCTGMEFAVEMIVKSALAGARFAEVPITLHPDGRTRHAPHLKTLRDGWRTLRFLLMHSPRQLFLVPGCALLGCGLLGYAVALPGLHVGGVIFDAHTLLFASLALLCGYQSLLFGILTKTFAMNERLAPPDPWLLRFYALVNLERGLALAAAAGAAGAGLLAWAVRAWWLTGFGRLDYAQTMRWVIPGATLVSLAFSTFLFGFFASILGMERRR